jgi:asparagine synthase (glutamine-hydrolysing)
MCGIVAIIGKTLSSHRMMQLIKTLKSRGPEGAALLIRNNVQLGFTRLAINDISKNGMQPMTSGDLSWICNGEVYNYKKLAKRHNIELKSGSDCEIIGPLIEKIGTKQFFRSLDGVGTCSAALLRGSVISQSRVTRRLKNA